MEVQKFIVLAASEREELVTSLQKNLEQWWPKWFAHEPYDVEAMKLTDLLEFDLNQFGNACRYTMDQDRWIVLSVASNTAARIGTRMLTGTDGNLGSGGSGPVLHDLVLQALQDLIGSWLGSDDPLAMNVEKTVPVESLVPQNDRRLGHDVLALELAIGDNEVFFLLPVRFLLSRLAVGTPVLPQSTDRLAQRASALSNQSVKLRTVLGELDLTLEALGELQPGDVIRLEKPITAPLSMFIGNSLEGFSGYLGKQQDTLAFKISAVLPSNG